MDAGQQMQIAWHAIAEMREMFLKICKVYEFGMQERTITLIESTPAIDVSRGIDADGGGIGVFDNFSTFVDCRIDILPVMPSYKIYYHIQPHLIGKITLNPPDGTVMNIAEDEYFLFDIMSFGFGRTSFTVTLGEELSSNSRFYYFVQGHSGLIGGNSGYINGNGGIEEIARFGSGTFECNSVNGDVHISIIEARIAMVSVETPVEGGSETATQIVTGSNGGTPIAWKKHPEPVQPPLA